MDVSYIKEQYSFISGDLLKSSLTINATIEIRADNVAVESTYRGIHEQLDGKVTGVVKRNYPQDLQRYYRIKVYPLEKTVTKTSMGQIEFGVGFRYEPYDMWFSCLWADVAVRSSGHLFDYAEYVQIEGNKYSVKGIVSENFGIEKLLHVFIVKITTT